MGVSLIVAAFIVCIGIVFISVPVAELFLNILHRPGKHKASRTDQKLARDAREAYWQLEKIKDQDARKKVAKVLASAILAQ